MDNQRNLILAVVLSGLLILGWDLGMRFFYPEASVTAAAEDNSDTAGAQSAQASASGAAQGAGELGGDAANAGPVDLKTALASETRVKIEALRIDGSINLLGGQVDDIELKDYRQAVEKDAPPVQLLSPANTQGQYFAEFGFIVEGKRLPSSTLWQADADTLTPDTPVTLTHTAQDGLVLSITYEIDDQFMISATQKVENTGESAAIVQPTAYLTRTSLTATPDQFIAHAGPIGVFGGTLQDPHTYEELAEIQRWTPEGMPNWLGYSDNYWLGALVPGEGDVANFGFRSMGDNLFLAGVSYESVTVPAGGSLTQSTQLYAGAKESALLDQYEEGGITYFGKAISWGWFEWFEKPLLWLLRTLHGLVGNFGVAIILLTVIIRGALFPIAQKQFASMAQMKAVQPKMKAIQERYKDDKQQQQQEVMKLYKDEGVNPLAGCLPLIIQIPIFFALYKVLILAIEMRHEPFIPFWIRDLSAPDPWTILNLFGLLPFEVPGFLGIGVLAVLLGVTMWLTFKLNPSAMDPMQQQIFNIMPWILMFVMAPFAAGLLIYWVTSNVLTLAQQTYLYSKHPQLRAAAEKEKAEKAKEKAAEADSKA